MFLPRILKTNLSLLTVFLFPPINIDKSLIEPLNFHLISLHQQIDLFFYLSFCFKRLKQVKELVEQSIQILLLPN